MTIRKTSHARSAGHVLEQHIRGHKIVQGAGEAWADVEAQIFRRAQLETEILVPAVAEPLLVWVMSGEAVVEERDLHGEWRADVVTAGSFYLTQAQSPYLMRWKTMTEQPFEVMHLHLGLELVGRAALSLGLHPARTRMRDVSAAQDVVVSGLLAGLSGELRAPHSASRLFVRGLVDSLTVHLLRHYAEKSGAAKRKAVQLPAWKLRKAIDHMETHLMQPFDLNGLAGLCTMSRYHFSRAFHNTMGQSPSRWFILRRLEHAKDMLRFTDTKIIEIAAHAGYESPSHFAKIFRVETGMTPRQYRNL